MATHFLRTWPQYFNRIADKEKLFEIRKNDRDFQAGDDLVLTCYDPEDGFEDGSSIEAKVLYVMPGGQFGIAQDHCVMSIRVRQMHPPTRQRA